MIVIQTVNICKINFIIIVFQTYTRKSEVHTKFFKSNKSKILIKIQKKKTITSIRILNILNLINKIVIFFFYNLQ